MLRLLTILAATAVLVSACSSSTDTGDGGDDDGNVTSSRSLVVNGAGRTDAELKGFSLEATAQAVLVGEDKTAVTFGGPDGNDGVFNIILGVAGQSTGDYAINAQAGNTLQLQLDGKTYVGSTGMITVTELNAPSGRCKGTFSGAAVELGGSSQVAISNGKFDCQIFEE